MTPSRILVFGNPRVRSDSIPPKILPELKKLFPNIKFETMDPTEIINQNEEELWILDTAEGIDEVRIINDPAMLNRQKRTSVHDYDLALDIKLLSRLGKLKKIKIIAVPNNMKRQEALHKVTQLLNAS